MLEWTFQPRFLELIFKLYKFYNYLSWLFLSADRSASLIFAQLIHLLFIFFPNYLGFYCFWEARYSTSSGPHPDDVHNRSGQAICDDICLSNQESLRSDATTAPSEPTQSGDVAQTAKITRPTTNDGYLHRGTHRTGWCCCRRQW